MDTAKPDLSQPELPPPEEKLLRAPTFFEKYGWAKTIIVIAIIVALIDIGIYYIINSDKKEFTSRQNVSYVTPSTTPDPTSSWKTYINQKGGFSFKYPSNYVVKENLTSVPQNIQLSSEGLLQNFQLTITYKPILATQTLDTLIAQNPLCPSILPANGTPSVINGEQPAQVYIDTPCGSLTKTVVYTTNNTIFYIMTIETQSTYEEVKKYTDQILATLQFLPVVSSQQTAPTSTSVCPADAKLCPDGSSVGRSGPKCEFAPCPTL